MKKGFTLVELLAAIIILGIVVSISIPIVKNVVWDSKTNIGLSEAKLIYKEIMKYCDTEEINEYNNNYVSICNENMNEQNIEKIVKLGNVKIDNIVYSEDEILDLEVEINNNKYVLYKNDMVLEKNIKSTDESCLKIYDNNGVKTLSGSKFDSSRCGTDLVIPEGIEEIKKFERKKLTSVRLPKSLKKIGNMAFSQNNLKYVNIPDGVEVIDAMAFKDNILENIKIPSTVKTIGSAAFASNKLTSIKISTSVTTLDGGAFADNLLVGDAAFVYRINNEGQIDETVLNSYAGANRENVIVPSKIKTISANAFWNTKVKNVDLPEGLINIEYGAFRNNDLKTVIIPSTVENIGSFSFYKQIENFENSNLTKIFNRTGRAFDWNDIIMQNKKTPFVTGTVNGVLITDK